MSSANERPDAIWLPLDADQFAKLSAGKVVRLNVAADDDDDIVVMVSRCARVSDAEESVDAFDPDDLAAALYRLRDTVFLAIDEEGATGALRRETCRNLLLLAGDIRVMARRKSTS